MHAWATEIAKEAPCLWKWRWSPTAGQAHWKCEGNGGNRVRRCSMQPPTMSSGQHDIARTCKRAQDSYGIGSKLFVELQPRLRKPFTPQYQQHQHHPSRRTGFLGPLCLHATSYVCHLLARAVEHPGKVNWVAVFFLGWPSPRHGLLPARDRESAPRVHLSRGSACLA